MDFHSLLKIRKQIILKRDFFRFLRRSSIMSHGTRNGWTLQMSIDIAKANFIQNRHQGVGSLNIHLVGSQAELLSTIEFGRLPRIILSKMTFKLIHLFVMMNKLCDEWSE